MLKKEDTGKEKRDREKVLGLGAKAERWKDRKENSGSSIRKIRKGRERNKRKGEVRIAG